jgi:radical SAM superfamily enzyme YgiQ (UPF0313 family)
VTKPGEPPAGLARLSHALKSRNLVHAVWDANLEGLLYLMDRPAGLTDTWTRRAANHVQENLVRLRSSRGYENLDRYKRIVADINRLVHAAGETAGCRASLSSYSDHRLSPLRKKDLLAAAYRFSENLFSPFFMANLPPLMEDIQTRLVGFSVNFLGQALCAFAMAGYIKRRWPGTRIVFGGGLVTSWMHVAGFSNPFAPVVDELVGGAGEAALVSMLTKESTSPQASFAEPGFDYTAFDLDAYLSPVRVLPYAVSRGCYWQKCRFCPEKYENPRYRAFDAASAASDVARQVRENDGGLVHFTDNALSPAFLKALIRCPPRAPWYGFARITPHLADPGFVSELKASGCVMLKLGIESGDQSVLDALGKGLELETAVRALETLRRAGIGTYCYLLFGTPAENLEKARKTLSFTMANKEAIDFLNLAVFNLPAGSADAQLLDTTDFYPADLSLYREFVHPEGWHRHQVRRFLENEFKRNPAIRGILKREPPHFTSNHAPFLCGTRNGSCKKTGVTGG